MQINECHDFRVGMDAVFETRCLRVISYLGRIGGLAAWFRSLFASFHVAHTCAVLLA